MSAPPDLSDPAWSAGELEALADTMFALSAPSRLQILAELHDGPRTVSQIVGAVEMEQSAVSHQLRVLREHSVVSVQRRGRERWYELRDPHVTALLADARRHVRGVLGPDAAPAGTAADIGQR